MNMGTFELEKLCWIGFGTAVIGVSVALFVRDWLKDTDYQRKHGGPRVYPIVGSTVEFWRNKHRYVDWVTGYLQSNPTYTDKRLFGRCVVMTGNPVNIEHILKTKFDTYVKGLTWATNTKEFAGKGLFNIDGEPWKVQRKFGMQEFSTGSTRDHIWRTITTEISKRLIPVLSKASELGTCVDLQDIFFRFTYDNICQMALGTDPGYLKLSLPKSAFVDAFETAADVSLYRFLTVPAALWKIKRFLNVGSENALRKAVVVVDEFVSELIRAKKKEIALRKDGSEGHSDFLSRLLLLAEEESAQERVGKSSAKVLTDVFCRDLVVSIILAGKDTTSSALTWFFWLLSTHPHVETAIEEELIKILQKRGSENVRMHSNFKHPDDATGNRVSVFNYEELKAMHYLHAALMESMRLYPPVPIELKVATQNDTWPDGTIVKKNGIVSFHMYAMGRLPSIWGPDAVEFKPERWLKSGEFVPESPYKYPVFQAGPRICLGKDMAMIQMKTVASSVIQNFSFSIPLDYKPQYVQSFTLRMRDGLHVTVRRKIPSAFHS